MSIHRVITEDWKPTLTLNIWFSVMNYLCFGGEGGWKGKKTGKIPWLRILKIVNGLANSTWMWQVFVFLFYWSTFLLSHVCLSSLESTMVFSGLFSNHLHADLSAACIPQEDRFYLVGNVCILRTQLLQVGILCLCFPHCGDVGFLWRVTSPLVSQPQDSIAKLLSVCRGLC